MSQFLRSWSLTIDGTDVSQLAMTFRVTKNLKPEPNQAEITVRNLAPATRKRLEAPKTLNVILSAGYQPTPHAIFSGEVRFAWSEIDGADIVTTIATGDKEAAIASSRASISMPSNATPQDILTQVAKSMRVGIGNLPQAIATQGLGGVATVIHGAASDALNSITRGAGLEWSIQDGALQVLPNGQALSSTAVVLSAATGLIGSPTVDSKGVMSCRALIAPDLTPGRLVRINGRLLQGDFRIEESQYSGDTHGNDWFVDLHCRKH
jgi:hypothetical protein